MHRVDRETQCATENRRADEKRRGGEEEKPAPFGINNSGCGHEGSRTEMERSYAEHTSE